MSQRIQATERTSGFYRLSSRVYKDAGDEESMEKERGEAKEQGDGETGGGVL